MLVGGRDSNYVCRRKGVIWYLALIQSGKSISWYMQISRNLVGQFCLAFNCVRSTNAQCHPFAQERDIHLSPMKAWLILPNAAADSSCRFRSPHCVLVVPANVKSKSLAPSITISRSCLPFHIVFRLVLVADVEARSSQIQYRYDKSLVLTPFTKTIDTHYQSEYGCP